MASLPDSWACYPHHQNQTFQYIPHYPDVISCALRHQKVFLKSIYDFVNLFLSPCPAVSIRKCDSAHLHPFWKELNIRNICFSWLFLLLPTLKNLRWRWGELKEIPSGLQSLWIFVKLTASAVAYLSKKIHQINPFPWWNISLNSQ